MPLTNCLNCTTKFEASLSELNRGNAKFCSRTCFGEHRSNIEKEPNSICAYCEQPFYRPPSKKHVGKSGLFFCSRQHKDLAQRLGGLVAIQPAHYGNGNGLYNYRKEAFVIHGTSCDRCGYNDYVEVLQVHHRDGNRKNNPPDGSNWQVLCPTHHKEEDLKLSGAIV